MAAVQSPGNFLDSLLKAHVPRPGSEKGRAGTGDARAGG